MERFTGPHDYFDRDYVDNWAEVANTRRPHRTKFFEAFITVLSRLAEPDVLDLGAGPGFLAEQVLARCAVSSYHLLDFSPRMIELARARLAGFGDRVFFHQADFLQEDWWRGLPQAFDVVVSMQAVHEVRDAEALAKLYSGVASIVREDGKIIVADKLDFVTDEGTGHFTVANHERALEGAGFRDFRRVLEIEDLIMFEAIRTAARTRE